MEKERKIHKLKSEESLEKEGEDGGYLLPYTNKKENRRKRTNSREEVVEKEKVCR